MSHGRHRNRPRNRYGLRETGDDSLEPDWRVEQDAELAKLSNGYREPENVPNVDLQAEAKPERADVAEHILKHRRPRWVLWLFVIGGMLAGGVAGYVARVLTE